MKEGWGSQALQPSPPWPPRLLQSPKFTQLFWGVGTSPRVRGGFCGGDRAMLLPYPALTRTFVPITSSCTTAVVQEQPGTWSPRQAEEDVSSFPFSVCFACMKMSLTCWHRAGASSCPFGCGRRRPTGSPHSPLTRHLITAAPGPAVWC